MDYATKQDMTNLKQQFEELDKRMDKNMSRLEGKMDAFMTEIRQNFVSKEVCNLSHGAQKDAFDRFEKTVSKVIWVAATETIGLLVATIFFLLNYFK